jgi:hypothetical protein
MRRPNKWRIITGAIIGSCVGVFVTPVAGLASAFWFAGSVLAGMAVGLLVDVVESISLLTAFSTRQRGTGDRGRFVPYWAGRFER